MTRTAKTTIVLGIAILLLCVPFLFEDGIDEVAVRTWIIDTDSSTALPEMADDELAIPRLAQRPSFGVAFSGGGTRSASATLGQLRALHRLGWLQRTRYISSNSGGSWATVPYTYLPSRISDEQFLGTYIAPDDLNNHNMRPSMVDELALSTAIHNADTVGEFLEMGRGDEAYSDIVASIFLEPFGLHDNEKFFTFHQAALDSALASNPGLSANDFQLVEHDDRPYPIITGVMIGQQLSEDPEEYFPIDMTPLYTGIRGRFELQKDGQTVVVGGGYVESFGYDSYEPHGNIGNGRSLVRLTGLLERGDKPYGDRYRFTLSDMIGASSAAPLATLSRSSVPNFLFPEFRHWPVDRRAIEQSDEVVRREADEFQHGDGADMDNLALTPLLVRRTENILVFINSEGAFQRPAAGCQNLTEEHLTDDVISYFRSTGVLIHNIVFDNGDEELKTICEAFSARKEAGEPLVYCQAYDVLENKRHGILPYRTSICWTYLDRVDRWMEQLDRTAGDLVRQLYANEGPFGNFPHYLTFAEQGVSLIDLNREHVIALSNLTAWTVLESADYVAENLGL